MKREHLYVLIILYAAAFIAAFNENIINVALADIVSAFDVTYVTSQWLVTGYMIVTAIMVAMSAFLYRRFALRYLVLAGAAFLAAGSLGAFFSASFPALLSFRLVQALGTGIFIPTMMSSVLAMAPKQKLGTFLAIGSCCITFGPAVSPVVSGFMVSALGWRYIFAVPFVAIIACALVGLFTIRGCPEASPASLDYLSTILVVVGLTALVFGFSQLLHQTAAALSALIAGAASVVFFVRRQLRLDDPILDIRVFEKQGFLSACILSMIAMFTTFSMSVILVLYFEGALGFSAFAAGALLLVPILVNSATALVAGRVMDAKGTWPLIPLGFLLIAVGQSLVAFFAYDSLLIEVVFGASITFAGVGLVMAPSQTAGLSLLSGEQHASGVSVVNLFVQVAACLGPALLIGIYSSVSGNTVKEGLPLTVGEAHGFSSSVWAADCVALVGFALSLWFSRYVRGANAHSAPLTGTAMAEMPIIGFAKKDVFSVASDATVAQAIGVLLETESGAIPIVDMDKRVVGFLSDGDVIRYLSGGLEQPLNGMDALAQMLVRHDLDNDIPEMMAAGVLELATRKVVCVDANDTLKEVLGVLSDKQVKKVPVLEGGTLVGTVSRSDLMRVFLNCQVRTI